MAKAPDITTLLRSRQTLIWVATREELRVERIVIEAAAKAGFTSVMWDCARGTTTPAGDETKSGDRGADPEAALRQANDRSDGKEVWIMRDLHRWLGNPTTVRAVKNSARDMQGRTAAGLAGRAIIVIANSTEIPEDLRGLATVIDWPLPTRDEVAAILEATVAATVGGLQAAAAAGDSRAVERIAVLRAGLENGAKEAAVDAAVGLTAEEIAGCYARSLVSLKRIDPETVRNDKAGVITASKVLEWYDPDPRGLDAVGGLDGLKGWLRSRRSAFSARARAFGLPAPKGVMLVGVPGCGKSLTAKAVATAWGMPLLRLDLGAMRSKYVGESEGNIRRALQTAEAVSPSILWLDEIEKALGGSTGPQGDGGVAADALGAILTWMQERGGNVFVVATANDAAALPPELLRKGRFDEVFFVDLPQPQERAAVLDAALRGANRDATGIDTAAVVAATHTFTGSEIANLIPDALFTAFADGERALTTADILGAAATVVPLAKTAEERITKLRAWAAERARPASLPEAAAPQQPQAAIGRAINLD